MPSRQFEYQRQTLKVRQIGTSTGMKIVVSDAKHETLTAVLENVVCEVVQ
jgi:hypothetical protein